MRIINNHHGNHRSVRMALAGVLTLGLSSAFLVAGLAMVSAPTASAAASAPITLASTSVGATYTSTTLTEPTAGTWAISSGALPPGLALTTTTSSATNTISGSPTSDGTYNFTITVTGSTTYSQAYTLVVTGIAPNTLTSPVLVNVAFSSGTLTVATAGTWAISSGALPPGLAFASTTSSATDSIAGTPTADGTYNFTVIVTDSTTPATYTQAYSLVVASQIPQPALKIFPVVAALEHPIKLITTGGGGVNSPTFTVTDGTATGCAVSGSTLTATTVGTCTVTATEAASSTYLAVSSDPVTFTFVTNPPAPRIVTATRVTGVAEIGRTVTLTIVGKYFTGKPSIKSTNPGTRVVVTRDKGSSLTVRVTASSKAHKGSGTFTITEASGISCRVRYVTK